MIIFNNILQSILLLPTWVKEVTCFQPAQNSHASFVGPWDPITNFLFYYQNNDTSLVGRHTVGSITSQLSCLLLGSLSLHSLKFQPEILLI